MNKRTLIKAARMTAANPTALRGVMRKSASAANQVRLEKCADAIKALYNLKLASMDLLDQAQRDPDLAAFLQSRQ